MTNFSDPVVLPWEREASIQPTYESDTPFLGAARMTADIALVAYGETVVVGGTPYNVTSQRPTIAAVRYTDAGPVVGPALILPTPVAQAGHRVEQVMSGADGEAWILTAVKGDYPAANYMRMGRVTVDPTTLALSISWRWELPTEGFYNSGVIWADIWLAQRRVFITLMNSPTAGGMNERSTYLVDLDTGAMVTHRALPAGSGTRGIYVMAFAFHPDRQEILVAGDRTTGGYDRPTLFTAPVTASTIGVWTRVEVPTLSPYADDIWWDGVSVAPASSNSWQVLGIWSKYDDGRVVNGETYWGSPVVRNWSFTPPSLTEHPVAISTNGKTWNSERESLDVEVRDGRLVFGVAELSDRTATNDGTGAGGVKHVEMGSDRATPEAVVTLPQSPRSIFDSTYISVVALGAERYIYLVAGVAITIPYVSAYASMQFLVYAGGPNMAPPFVPGIKGAEPPIENRRVFRRVN